jgi:hypothetical protein
MTRSFTVDELRACADALALGIETEDKRERYRLVPRESWEDASGRRKDVPNHVYFIRCGDYVKIGVASCVVSRLRTLEAMNPLPLEVVRVIAGKRDVERAFHVRFAAYRHRDEWFRVEGDLADFLGADA